MAPKARAVTAKSLQALLTRIGAPSSGTKVILQERLRREINQSRLFNLHPTWEKSRPTDQKLRIMSIDMGIKNLAFCEAEISYPVKGSLKATMDVLRWEKTNLVPTRDDIPAFVLDSDEGTENTADTDEDVDPYSLNILSKTAYGLVKSTILAGAPDIILIERQRWRSGGGSAVQQWTLRVNTLEGMLWAILQTMYYERLLMQKHRKGKETLSKEKLYEIFGVDPKRVGNYWLGEQDIERPAAAPSPTKPTPDTDTHANLEEEDATAPPKKKPSRSKAEKKAKISLLRTWLSASPASTAAHTSTNTPALTFTIGPHAQATQQALCSPKKSPRRKKDDEADEIGPTELKKLDDITDCFLQAAAWVSWESNRLQLCELVGDIKGEKVDEGVVREMVRIVQGEEE